jgi:hypothetical protein
MRRSAWALILPVAGACSNFGASAPEPGTSDGGTDGIVEAGPNVDSGGTADGSLDASLPTSPVVVRGVTSITDADSVSVQLPAGTRRDDLLWATVLVKNADLCNPTAGWKVEGRLDSVACSTVYSRIAHFSRVAGDAEPPMQSPCSATNTSPGSVSVVLAAFGGVDPVLSFEDTEFYSIALGDQPTMSLVAPAGTASSSATEAFAVFVDPDGHGDSVWAVPNGMTKRAASNGLALFVAAVEQAGPTPARETHKAPTELFCQTSQAVSIVLHPRP